MGDAPLPLDQENVVILVLEDEVFYGAIQEVGHYAIRRNSGAADHNSRLSCRQELGVVPTLLEISLDFQRGHHLSNAAVVADGVNAKTARPKLLGFGDFAE